MRISAPQVIALCLALASPLPPHAAPKGFSFGIIAHPDGPSADDAVLRRAVEETDADNLAFVTVQGIKAAEEPCSDAIYLRRKALLEKAQNGLVISLGANDWANCRSESGKPAAAGRLNRLRDLFFFDDFSLGASRIPVIRQSVIAKFRGFPENARWQIGNIMFATVNLPSNNNNYVIDAGRNSEFEDRVIADRDWLNRVFTFAQREKMAGIVLFCDGNPLGSRTSGTQRDGFSEARKLIVALAGKFPGRILVVSNQSKAKTLPSISWHGNMGELSTKRDWMKVKVDSAHPRLFSLEPHAIPAG